MLRFLNQQYDFEGRNDLVKFIKLVGAAGLYVHVRIGPYVCAEWNYGCVYSQIVSFFPFPFSLGFLLPFSFRATPITSFYFTYFLKTV